MRGVQVPPSSSGKKAVLRPPRADAPPRSVRPSSSQPAGRRAMRVCGATASTPRPPPGSPRVRNAASSLPTAQPRIASSAAVVDFPDWALPANSQSRPRGSRASAACTWCQPARRSNRISTIERNTWPSGSRSASAAAVRSTRAVPAPLAMVARARRGQPADPHVVLRRAAADLELRLREGDPRVLVVRGKVREDAQRQPDRRRGVEAHVADPRGRPALEFAIVAGDADGEAHGGGTVEG